MAGRGPTVIREIRGAYTCGTILLDSGNVLCLRIVDLSKHFSCFE